MRISEPADGFRAGRPQARIEPGSDAETRQPPQRGTAARLPVPVRRAAADDRAQPAARLAIASAPLIAQLIATEMGLPQTRLRRLAPVAEALAAYRGCRSLPVPGRSQARSA
ncbi:hypothetical protein EDC22_103180 [Tepidamorphus gemmatus]|uniref:Uncharacterized protein n=1 Tax=Tepidamorphus gemmatus TaxID=747076 RepID=A0A4R3MHI9_9HYPH|nr:hypothetical protein [Tepidamorphus gemmatus]TCT11867.1 hypothetical protein EDC22_103180 [Tepidamorphus gemmatus]